MSRGASNGINTRKRCFAVDSRTRRSMATFARSIPCSLRQSMSSAAASLVRIFQSQESAPVSPAKGAVCFMMRCESSGLFGPDSSFSRMSQDCCRAIEDSTSLPSCVKWAKAGIVRRSAGEFWTASTSEWPNAAVVCSLSQVLESDAPKKYWLSPRAAAGILRRAEKRGNALPPMLRDALLGLANQV